jgi:DNA primase
LFKVNNTYITTSEIDILLELRDQLNLNGMSRLKNIKPGPNNIQFTCPMHAEGQEKKPSCGVSTKEIENTPAGTVHCFSCGYTATLDQMISHCFKKDDDGQFGRHWLIRNFISIQVESRKPIELNYTRKKKNVTTRLFMPTEEELDSYRYYHPYMKKRKLTDEVIERFDIGYDEKTDCITFPVRNEKGVCLFIARRSVKSKFFNYPSQIQKPVYGLYEIPVGTKELIVCESPINAMTCYVYGKVGVALFGTGTPFQYEQLKKLPCRNFILATDPDKAGQEAAKKLRHALGKSKIVTQYDIPIEKDINDLSFGEFKNLKKFY